MRILLKTSLLLFFFAGPIISSWGNPVHSAVDSLNVLAWQKTATDKQIAIDLAKEAIKKAAASNYSSGLAESYNILAIAYRNLGSFLEADTFFLKSLDVRMALADSNGIASIYNNLGSLERERGRMEKAFDYLFRALAICERNGIDSTLAQCFDNIANAYESSGDLEKAITYALKNIPFYTEKLNQQPLRKDSQLIANAFYNLAIKYFYLDQYTAATENIQKAIPFFEDIGDWEGQAWSLNILYHIAEAEEQPEEAASFLQQGIHLYETHKDSSIGLFDLYLNLGVLELDRAQPRAALFRLKKASQLLGSKGGFEDQLLLMANLAETYSVLEQFDSAFHYRTLSGQFQDSLYNMEKTNAIAEMEIRFDTERKEKELVEEKLINQQRTTQRNTLFFLFLSALLFTLLLYFFLRQRQRAAAKIAKQQAQIQQQQIEELFKTQELNSLNAMLEGQDVERRRIAKDLHDRLGSMLTAIKWNFEGLQKPEQSEVIKKKMLTDTNQMLDETYHEVRKIAHNMVSGVLTKFGLVPALKELCSTISSSNNLQAEVLTFGLNDRLDNPIEITLYRIVQELISNVLKHAKASKITVQLHHINDDFSITVEDNGQGFLPAQAQNGMGLKNVEARVKSLNGTLFIDSGKGAGTSVLIEIPI